MRSEDLLRNLADRQHQAARQRYQYLAVGRWSVGTVSDKADCSWLVKELAGASMVLRSHIPCALLHSALHGVFAEVLYVTVDEVSIQSTE